MSEQSDVGLLLGKTKLFGSLGGRELSTIAARMMPMTFKPNTLIFARGDAGKDLHLVVDGYIRISVVTSEGRELSLLHAGRGDIVGEIAALDGGLRTASASSIGAVKTAYLSRVALQQLLEGNMQIAQAAIHFLCNRLRTTNEVLEAIALHPIEVRLARFFLAAARLRDGDASDTGRVSIKFAMSQSDLALLIGASRPKVSGAVQALEAANAIVRQGEVTVCDLAILERLAAFE